METIFWAKQADANGVHPLIELTAQTVISAKKEAFRKLKKGGKKDFRLEKVDCRILLCVRGIHKERCIAVRDGRGWKFNA